MYERGKEGEGRGRFVFGYALLWYLGFRKGVEGVRWGSPMEGIRVVKDEVRGSDDEKGEGGGGQGDERRIPKDGKRWLGEGGIGGKGGESNGEEEREEEG